MADYLQVASSGTLVAAALESAGYFYQSYLLDALASPFSESVGALLYVIGGIVALATFAVLGQYKLGFALLLWPGIFMATVFERTESTGTHWLFAKENRSEVALKEQINALTGKEGATDLQPVKVSTLFSKYNDLISSSSQEIVKVLVGEQKKVDANFILRNELFTRLHSQTIEDPGVRELIHSGFLRHCRSLVVWGRKSRQPNLPPSQREHYKQLFDMNYKIRQIRLNSPTLDHLADLKADYQTKWASIVTNGGEIEDAVDVRNIYSWLKDLDKGETQLEGAARLNKIQQMRQEVETEGPYSCNQIWNLVMVDLHRYAKRAVGNIGKVAALNGIDEQEIYFDLAKMAKPDERNSFGNGSAEDISRVLDILYKYTARFILRNEIHQGNISSFLYDYVNRTKEFNEVDAPGETGLAFVERARVGNKEWQERTRLMTSAATLPYYQGLLLYFLAITFPLFALLLLIPGKHPGFLLWFVLWLWAKSWDIGFAIVMLLDNVLFSLIARGLNAEQGLYQSDNPRDYDFASYMFAIQEMDPTFQLSTYYSIVAVALQAVPIVTSYLILGTMRGGSGLISAGMDNYSNTLASAARFTTSQEYVTGLKAQANDMKIARTNSYLKNDKKGNNRNADLENPTEGNKTVQYADRTDNRIAIVGGSADTASNWAEGLAYAEGGLSALGGSSVTTQQKGRNISGLPGGARASVAPSPRGMMVAGRVARAVNPLVKQAGKSLLDLRSAELDQGVEWGNYDAFNSSDVQELAAYARVYGMFEMPWIEREGGWGQELKGELAEWNAIANMANASLESISQLFKDRGIAPNPLNASNSENPLGMKDLKENLLNEGAKLAIGAAVGSVIASRVAGSGSSAELKDEKSTTIGHPQEADSVRLSSALEKSSLNNPARAKAFEALTQSGGKLGEAEANELIKELHEGEQRGR